MPNSFVSGSAQVTHWGASHKSADGRLISRQAIVPPPDFKPCIALTCLRQYFMAHLIYILTLTYHAQRVEYAEKMRSREIPEHYRTGENVPVKFWGLVWVILTMPH
jgi:hypothetical protein